MCKIQVFSGPLCLLSTQMSSELYWCRYLEAPKCPGTVRVDIVSSPSQNVLTWPRVYGHSTEVLLTTLSWQECCLRNWEDEKWITSSLTRLVDIEDPPREVEKPWFQTNGVYELQDPEGTDGVWTDYWSPATMGLHRLTFLHCLVDQTFVSKTSGVAP